MCAPFLGTRFSHRDDLLPRHWPDKEAGGEEGVGSGPAAGQTGLVPLGDPMTPDDGLRKAGRGARLSDDWMRPGPACPIPTPIPSTGALMSTLQ